MGAPERPPVWDTKSSEDLSEVGRSIVVLETMTPSTLLSLTAAAMLLISEAVKSGAILTTIGGSLDKGKESLLQRRI